MVSAEDCHSKGRRFEPQVIPIFLAGRDALYCLTGFHELTDKTECCAGGLKARRRDETNERN